MHRTTVYLMHKITSYANYSDLELIALALDRFFANELIIELAQRFNDLILPDTTEKDTEI